MADSVPYGNTTVLDALPQAEDRVDALSPCASAQLPALIVCRDTASGTQRLRTKCSDYLPRNPGEHIVNYTNRVKRSVLFNGYARTIRGLAGLVFRTDPKLGDDVPVEIAGNEDKELEGQWENIDLAGTHGDVFARGLLEDVLDAGHCAIFVDYPNIGGALPRGVEKAPDGPRPYWRHIRKDDIVSWRTEVDASGRTHLAQVVLRQTSEEARGEFRVVATTSYLVLRRDPTGVVSFQVWVVPDVAGPASVTAAARVPVLDKEGVIANQTEIPLAVVYGPRKNGILESDPPLLDLAFINLAHFEMSSDYRTSIHMASGPIYVRIGAELNDDKDNEGAVVLGPSGIVDVPIGGDFKLAEHAGHALATTRTALEDLKAEMATMGLAMLASEKRVAETAEAKRIDKTESDSALAVTSRSLQDALEVALGFHANYLGLDDGGSIAINRDFENVAMDARTVQYLSDMVARSQLSLETMWESLAEGGVLPEGFDAETERDRMASDMPPAPPAGALPMGALPAAPGAVPPVPPVPSTKPDAVPVAGTEGNQ